MIVFAGIVPHPPILVPEIGGEESQKVEATKRAYDKIATSLAAVEPDVLIVVSPHMMHYPHLFTVCGMSDLAGSFEAFGHPEMTGSVTIMWSWQRRSSINQRIRNCQQFCTKMAKDVTR